MTINTRQNLVLDKAVEVSISEEVEVPLMICSHERSGTHFLMNSISNCTSYQNIPYLDFDLHTLGSTINFFSEEDILNFYGQ